MVSRTLFILAASCVAVTADNSAVQALQKQFLRYKKARRSLLSLHDLGPSVHVSNRVYRGTDKSKACGSEAVELLEGSVGDDIVYCFKVTNDGSTYLNGIKVSNEVLEYTDAFDGTLAPGKSVVFTLATSIVSTVTVNAQVNRVDVTANPVTVDGIDMTDEDVTYMDSSSVAIKSAFTAAVAKPNSCLKDSWREAISSSEVELVCSANDVSFMPNSVYSSPMSCVAGETFRADIKTVMSVSKTVYDLGWYIATDGGDALTGKCTVNGFQQGLDYPSINSFGMISFEEESIVLGKVDDRCGDVAVFGEDGLGYEVEVPLGFVTLKCADENEDGAADMKVCFTWSTEETDQQCTLLNSDVDTVGSLPDLYPGAPTGSCFCTTYDIPTISVTKDKACL